MAAPRKDEERLRLYAAALKLFGEKGYAATSYQDIADACDTSKSVVQHYYPHKEMFLVLYLDEHFAWVRETAQKLCPSHTSAIQLLCMMGFVHLDRLVAEEKGSPLIQDLLGFRTFIEGVVMRERDWIVAHWPDAIDKQYLGDCLVVALNGAYGLLSIASLEGRIVTPEYVMRLSFAPFAISQGLSPEYVENVIEECSVLQVIQ
ncbi:MAG TPA: TetR/AcrR family transcriptional regulator [Coriobacteriaceae bacterium]|nr:TetR/AcrR family transcriptional regulator [Coriobacteriaceae bacterium]